jgi:hypothetical protein
MRANRKLRFRHVFMFVGISSFGCQGERKKSIESFCSKALECYPGTDYVDCVKTMDSQPEFVSVKPLEQISKMTCLDVSVYLSDELKGGK